MIYKTFKDIELSWLGMGNMRLPIDEKTNRIDRDKAQQIITYAYEQGVNYFDTAFRYHNGESEEFIGQALKNYPRETWYLASKMPGHMMKNNDGKLEMIGYLTGEKITSIAEVFEQQLAKCQVDYFDFYLLHNLNESSLDFYTDEQIGVVDYLQKQKESGRIKHLGFSAHARPETIEKFLSRYDSFDFIQLQLNYLDWSLQDARRKYKIAVKHHLPVVVMEPLRGGRLANPGLQAESIFRQARPHNTAAVWAFRFLQSLPDVVVVLSGMNTLDQLKENIRIFSVELPLNMNERQTIEKAVSSMADLVPCTACGYCLEACPQNLNIPGLISMFNELTNENPVSLKAFLKTMPESQLPSACIACGACQEFCPQEIKIPDVLAKFALANQNIL